jgi:hypothetical protein
LARSDEPNTHASTYSPQVDFTLSNTATGAASDIVIAPFNLPSGTVNFGGVVLSGPGSSAVACAPDFGGTCPNPPAGSSPILGDVVGTLSSSTFLGVSNTPCSTNLTVTFVFINATVNNSAGNLIKPSLQTEADSGGTLSPLLHDVNQVSDHAGGDDIGKSAAGSAISPANGLPAHVDLYPSYLNVVFDPDTPSGPNPPVQPLARYSGGQIVVGTSVILTNQYFAPGALAAFAPPHPYFDLAGTALGYTTISVLQDTTVEVAPTAITDFCTPLELTATTFGTSRVNPCNGNTLPPCNTDVAISNPAPGVPTGRVRSNNPTTAGTYYFGAYQFSQRDSDNDGLENAFDTCPYTANTDGDPRTSAGPDTDMLDSACDPDDTGNNPNQDGDIAANGGQWLNALDNCPLLGNPTNGELETSELENVRRPRGGPATDSIGDVCDAAETTCGANVDNDLDGLVNDGCPTVGTAAAETTCTFSTSAEVDNDLDGFPNDGCPNSSGSTPEGGADGNGNGVGDQCEDFANADPGDDSLVNEGCPAQGGAELGCLNSADDDGDGSFNDGCRASASVASGHYHTDWDLAPVCIGGIDVDGDGYCTAGGTGNPNDPNDSNANVFPETYSQFRPFMVAHSGSGANPPASREPLQICNDGIDNDGDTLVDINDGTATGASATDDCRPPDSVFTAGADTDGDGSRDAVEIHLGSDPLSRCHRGNDPNSTTPSRGWGRDVRGESAFSGDKVNVQDLQAVFSHFGSPPGPPFDRRFDLRPGSTLPTWINVQDLAAVASASAIPSHGISAWLFGSVCSAHKVYND